MNSQHLVITQHNTLQGICEVAVNNDLTHVWVHMMSGIEYIEEQGNVLGEEWEKPLFNYQFKTGAKNNHLVSVYTRKLLPGNRKSHPILVTFLAYSPWGWKDLAPAQVLELAHLVEKKLEVSTGAPGMTGMRYAHKIITKYHPKRLARPTADLSVFRYTQPLVWDRVPTAEELDHKYLYYMDRNSSYPRVGVAEKFGVGEPTHYFGRDFDHKLPGMWLVDVLYSPDFDERLPHPLYKIEGREWLPTAIVKVLISCGCLVEAKEALVFEKAEYVFKDSIENLWALRSQYAKGTPERDAFKNVMNSMVGSNNAGFDNWKNRPDWYGQFVAGARSMIYYNIYKIAENDNMYPIHCSTDALMYLSDQETAQEALPSMRIADNLGCYKQDFRLEVTDEVREILTKYRLGNRIHLLRSLEGGN